ncbi:MAG: hypothetical protein FWB76_02735 [Oscillospiraceae bacterium]|nr:hypothetical protein [Oscillospiraceae bacterium]
MSRFNALRLQHPVFHYHSYAIEPQDEQILLRFHFSIDGLGEFCPTTTIDTRNLTACNALDSPLAQDLVFSLGLVELISYWKCACPPEIVIHCGHLNRDEIDWWKRLWYHGLGEFFYRNEITTNFDEFARVRCEAPVLPRAASDFHSAELSLVPIGGGKDSCVSLHLLSEMKRKLMGFTVNDQPARTETFAAAGYSPEQMLRTHRQIDPMLLRVNAQGYLNGHTPFSAIVAFLGLFCAYLIGADELVLSNEASANEPSVLGTDVNHQYSKSYAFECDMNAYIRRRFALPIQYFSLLRPFNELQIAKQFSALTRYHETFKSCNVGSKQNVWCARCAKCLFVYLMLAPFLSSAQTDKIFGENLLELQELSGELQGLLGQTAEKPFECVGTVAEAKAAVRALSGDTSATKSLLCEWNAEHNLPPAFRSITERMHDYVSTTA